MSRSPPSSRWCPTAEQLVILRELYARGLTNSNAFQIQTITAQLSNYGKIQGKNVFYWFQNHKARERQKLRNKRYVVVKQQHLMQQSQINPSSAFLQLFTSYSPQYLYPQGAGEASSEGMTKQAWRPDLPTDYLIRTNGHDLAMIMDANPSTVQCCRDINPLETLELFPLRSGIL